MQQPAVQHMHAEQEDSQKVGASHRPSTSDRRASHTADAIEQHLGNAVVYCTAASSAVYMWAVRCTLPPTPALFQHVQPLTWCYRVLHSPWTCIHLGRMRTAAWLFTRMHLAHPETTSLLSASLLRSDKQSSRQEPGRNWEAAHLPPRCFSNRPWPPSVGNALICSHSPSNFPILFSSFPY